MFWKTIQTEFKLKCSCSAHKDGFLACNQQNFEVQVRVIFK